MIAEPWRKGRVSDFFELQRGFDLTKKQAKEGNIPVISSSGISFYHNEAKAKGPGVITGRKGSVGNVVYYEGDYWPHDTSLWVKDFKGNYPRFVFHFLQAMQLERYDEASSVPTLNRNNVHSELCQFPPFDEQVEICRNIDTWNLAIEKTEQLIAAKEKSCAQLSYMLLFGNKFPDSDASKRNKWFAVPSTWEIVQIGNVAQEVKVTNDSGEDLPVLSCTKYDGLVNSLEYFGKQVFSLDTSTYKVVSRGQFAYATNHIEEGSIGYQNLHDKGLVSPMYTVFETGKNIDDGYLFKVLKTETFRHIFQVNTSASVDRRGSLRWHDFKKLPIPLPPLDEQRRISATLDVARQEIDLLKKQADALRRQKRGLMQKLLTGEWRVKH